MTKLKRYNPVYELGNKEEVLANLKEVDDGIVVMFEDIKDLHTREDCFKRHNGWTPDCEKCINDVKEQGWHSKEDCLSAEHLIISQLKLGGWRSPEEMKALDLIEYRLFKHWWENGRKHPGTAITASGARNIAFFIQERLEDFKHLLVEKWWEMYDGKGHCTKQDMEVLFLKVLEELEK